LVTSKSVWTVARSGVFVNGISDCTAAVISKLPIAGEPAGDIHVTLNVSQRA
jgi:hypothetical protein